MKRLATFIIMLLLAAAVHAQNTENASTLLDTLTLEAGSVTAQKNLVVMEVDRLTYKVEDDVDSKNSSVLDMLRKVPMVAVDGQDNITVNGSSSFQIYVDGKPNAMVASNPSMIFKMMPASSIKNIEVITNPGAKYDAEGASGILNLTTTAALTGGKAVAESHYGNVTLQGSTRSYGGSGLYSMQKGKFALSLNASVSKTYNNKVTSETEWIQKVAGTEFRSQTTGIADTKTPLYTGNLNLSYEIDSLNLITAGAGYLGTYLSCESLYETIFSGPGVEYSLEGTLQNRTTSNSVTADANYQHTWAGNPEKSLVILYQFTGTPTRTQKTSLSGGINSLTNSLNHIIQTDFSTPLGKNGGQIFNTGLKYTARHNFSDQNDYVFDGDEYISSPAGSLAFDYFNNIGAAYAEYSGQFAKVGLKAGLRYEHTWQSMSEDAGQNFSISYGNLVPVASIQYNIGMKQNIGLSYNMRISRPGITCLNPHIDDLSVPNQKSYGNPDLLAETGHNISLVYNYFSPKWIVSATLRQSFTDNGISQYSFYDSGALNTTYGNLVKTSSTNLNAFLTWIPGQKTRIVLNGSTGYTDIRSKELEQENSGWTYTMLFGLQQVLPWDIRLSINSIASGRTIMLQGYSSGLLIGTLGLTKTFLDDRLGLSLSGLTHLTGGKDISISTYSQTKDHTSRTTTNIPLRMLSLSLSYSFGKQDGTSMKRVRKSIDADEQLNTKSTSGSLVSVMNM